jgi:hypothetical protein
VTPKSIILTRKKICPSLCMKTSHCAHLHKIDSLRATFLDNFNVFVANRPPLTCLRNYFKPEIVMTFMDAPKPNSYKFIAFFNFSLSNFSVHTAAHSAEMRKPRDFDWKCFVGLLCFQNNFCDHLKVLGYKEK